MTTNTTEKKIGHSKADSVGKKEAPKKEATKKPEQKAKTEEAPAAEAPKVEAPKPTIEAPPVTPEVNTAILPPGSFAPKPAVQKKGKANQKDFVHAHIGPERLKQIQKLQETTGYSRTELVQQAWDNFVDRADVKAHLK